jgi:hypothetical protein
MYGTTSPSGKLPYTIAKQPSDYGAGWNSALVDNLGPFDGPAVAETLTARPL